MITSKHINKIIIGFLIMAIIFTGIIMYLPRTVDIEENSTKMDYESRLFNKDGIISIDIKADENDWANMLENATKEEYISCDVTINGTTFSSVGIRPKGNSSLSMVAGSDSDRFSFKFEFDHYIDGQTCFGLDKLVINNIQSDTTYMKEYMSYELMTYMGVRTPLYAYTEVTVNGEDWGFYLAVEALEESFAQRNYGTNHGMLYKPESMGARGKGMMNDFINNNNNANKDANNDKTNAQKPQGNFDNKMKGNMQGGFPGDFGGDSGGGFPGGFGGGTGGGTDLIYTDDKISSYSNIFDSEVFKGTDKDYSRVTTALKNLNEGTNLEKYINVDEVLKYIAVNTFVVNLDSYFSNMKHNYYLYEEEGQLSMLPWDYNLAFAGFQSGSAGSAVNFPIDTPVSGVELSERPMVAKLLEVDEYKEKYHQYLQEIVDGYINNGTYEATINKVDSLISEYVKNDPSSFGTYEQYTAAVPVLIEFGKLRAKSIKGQLEGTIPSTTEGQNNATDKLIDASGINLSTMGSQGGGRMGNRNNSGSNGIPNDRGNMQMPDNMPEGDVMRQAMEIIQSADGKELTDEQISQLKELGLTDDQIEFIKNMGSMFGNRGNMGPGGGMPGDFNGQQDGKSMPGMPGNSSPETKNGISIPAVIAYIAVMAAGLLFVIKFKRRRI